MITEANKIGKMRFCKSLCRKKGQGLKCDAGLITTCIELLH